MCNKNPKNQYAKNFDTALFLLNIKIYSGQNCIINESTDQRVYLEVSLRGNKKEEDVNQMKSSLFENQGYYIYFDFEC